jgi:hypothetical protein
VSKAEHRTPFRLLFAVVALALCALGFGVASATAEAPAVTAPVVSDVSYATAHVEGEVDPNGEGTEWFVEVSTNGTDWERTNVGGFIEGTGLQSVEGELEGLKPGTNYEARLSAMNYTEFVVVSSPEPNPKFTTKPLPAPTVSIDPVTTFTGTTATFKGKIDTNSPAGEPAAADVDWHFECSPECPNVEGGTVEADENGAPQAVEAHATGLEPNTTYDVTLVGKNAGDPVSAGPVSFKTDAVAPEAETIPAFALAGGTEAQLGGRVNPRNSQATYWFEYGTTTAYGSSVPTSEDGDAGAGPTEVVVSREISGLSPNTTYHYRVVAESASSVPVFGGDMTFATPTAALQQPAAGSCPNEQFRVGLSAGLPDCRAYELVSPPDLGGSSVRVPASADQAWVANTAHPVEFPVAATDGNSLLWKTDAVIPGDPSSGVTDTYLSRRGATGWSWHRVGPPGEETPGGAATLNYASPSLDRLIFFTFGAALPGDDGPTRTPFSQDFYREEPDGTFAHLNVGSEPESSETEQPAGDATTPDALSVIFQDPRRLEPGAASCDLYLRSENSTEIVSRDENDVPVCPNPRSAVLSADGSTLAFVDNGERNLFLRDLDAGQAIAFPFSPSFQGYETDAISDDGTRLVFDALPHLTADDQDAAVDIYEFDRTTESFTRLSAASGSPASSGNAPPSCGGSPCAPRFLQATKDLGGVYFFSPELLDGHGVEGAPNLYFRADGQTGYVATLASSDRAVTERNESIRRNGHRLAADGSTLLFESTNRITAYDNGGVSEIYAFDPGTGRTTCVSCRSDGEAPQGAASLSEAPEGTPPTKTDAAFYALSPVNTVNSDLTGTHFYFQTSDALVAADINDEVDVYEYDVASATPALISSGKADTPTALWGNSADGRDVFIVTAEPLTAGDRSVSAVKAYDARIGGGFPISVVPPPCQGEGCRNHGSPVPPGAVPPTSSFEGPGNRKPKAKHKHKKKHHEHKKHHKRRHHKHKNHGNNAGSGKRDAGNNGRTGR